MVGRDEDVEMEFPEVVQELGEESLLRPSNDLPGHAQPAELHSVHDFIHLVERQPEHAGLGSESVRQLGQI